MANGEPVNERPLLPSLHRTDAIGVGHWSSDLIRQLITVFQQYGFRINQSVTEDALAAELTGYVGNAPDSTVTDLNDVTGGAFRVIATTSSTGNIPPDTNGFGVVLHVGRASSRRIQVHLFDNVTGVTPAIHIRVEGSGGFGDWHRVVMANQENNFVENQTFSAGPGTVKLKSNGSSDHVFLEFFARDAALATRSGWLGYPGSGSTELRLTNQIGIIALSDQGGVIVGSPTGGAQGTGTINAHGVYDDGVLLTDYVFDAEIDRQVDTEFYDQAVPDRRIEGENGKIVRVEKRTHAPARQFSQNMDELNPGEFEQKWRASRKLPAMTRIPEKPSLGEYAQALLETCEVQAVHIAKLEARIRALEADRRDGP